MIIDESTDTAGQRDFNRKFRISGFRPKRVRVKGWTRSYKLPVYLQDLVYTITKY